MPELLQRLEDLLAVVQRVLFLFTPLLLAVAARLLYRLRLWLRRTLFPNVMQYCDFQIGHDASVTLILLSFTA